MKNFTNIKKAKKVLEVKCYHAAVKLYSFDFFLSQVLWNIKRAHHTHDGFQRPLLPSIIHKAIINSRNV